MLSIFKGVQLGGWGWPIAISILLRGMISWAFRKVPLVSASAEEDTTFRIVLHRVKMGPFVGGFVMSSLVR